MPSAPTSENRLPRQRRDRRAAFTALALLLVAVGALGSALVVYRSGHRTDVLMAAHEIHVGDKVTEADFETARVAADQGETVPVSAEHLYISSYATTDIPANTLITSAMFQVGSVIPRGGVVVGVTVSQQQRPAAPLAVGDVVRAFLVPTNSSTNFTPGTVLVDAARVTDVSSASSGAITNGADVTVSLLVPESLQDKLASAAGQSAVLLALLPADTKPLIDFRTNT